MEQLKNCTTCGHRKDGMCQLSGLTHNVERVLNSTCDVGFSGWVPRPPSLFRRLIEAIIKKLS